MRCPAAAPATARRSPRGYARARPAAPSSRPSPSTPTVTEHALTRRPRRPARASARRSRPAPAGPGPGSTEVVSEPQEVLGYGAVGVTWARGSRSPEDALGFEVRTRTGGTWSDWMRLAYDADEGPDPDSDEGRHARPGTDPMLVGDVDQVQVRAISTDGEVPADMELAVIDPGETDAREESPAIDTDTLALAQRPPPGRRRPAAPRAAPAPGRRPASAEGRDVHAHPDDLLPRPVGRRRADARPQLAALLRGARRLRAPHGQRQHYTRDQVPGIIRGIYAYHTRSKGWSDIGYNFLVDRFGRIWEGRYGGVDRPVVGAHTLGYNDYAFAMSAIGNYDIAQPSDAIVQAYGALFAWKLSLHGVDASSTSQQVGPDHFQAINGHRDAGQTACPGRYLYAKIPEIRSSPPRPSAAGRARAGVRPRRPRRTPTSSCGGPATARPS